MCSCFFVTSWDTDHFLHWKQLFSSRSQKSLKIRYQLCFYKIISKVGALNTTTSPTLLNHCYQPSAPYNQTSYPLAKQRRRKRKPSVLFDPCCFTWMAGAPGAPRSHGFFQRFQKWYFWRAMPGGIHRGVPTAPGSFLLKKKTFWARSVAKCALT